MGHPVSTRNAGSLVDILRWRAEHEGDRIAFTYLRDGEVDEVSLTYRQLHERSVAIAASIRAGSPAGERALLLYPSGLEFIEGFFGCLYAGLIAVPAYPPPPARAARHAERLERIVRDAAATLLLSTSEYLRDLQSAPGVANLRAVATDRAPDGTTADTGFAPRPEQLAFLQYTSGSTSDPKGTMVTHGNVIANARATQRLFTLPEGAIALSWLPFYHDMGLIGKVLSAVAVGVRTVLMAPSHFVERPERWLLGIARYRAFTSSGPNFAYDLCTRLASDELVAQLDLSSWKIAINGAEPVREATLVAFARRFAPCGFQPSAFCPSYGLAESTLLVSGGPFAGEQGVEWLDREALSDGRVLPADGREAVPVVSCGTIDPAAVVEIVDPQALVPAEDRHVGEIWISSPSVAAGYWRQPEMTAAIFGAALPGNDRRFLRTGDLGFIDRGRLFITGRLKDLLIIRGRNHYPQDVEYTVLGSHEGFSPIGGAAFTVDTDTGAGLVVVHAIDRRKRFAYEALAAAAREAVLAAHDVAMHDLVLIDPRDVPKTSSGKIRRQECKRLYLEGHLNVRYAARQTPAAPVEATTAVAWRFEEEVATAERSALTRGMWVVYGTGGNTIAPRLHRAIRERGDGCVLFEEGAAFEHLGNGMFGITVGETAVLTGIIAERCAAERAPLRGIVFACDHGDASSEPLEARYASLVAAFAHCRALASGRTRPRRSGSLHARRGR